MMTRTPFAALTLLAGLLMSAPAVAAAPVRETVDFAYIDDYLSEHCGFPVGVRTQGTIIYRDAGSSVSTEFADYRTTFINLNTGASADLRMSGVSRITSDFADGVYRYTVSFSGAPARFVVPGQGAVLITAGRSLQIFVVDTNTGTFTFDDVEHGRQGQYLTVDMVCAALSR